MTIVCPSKRAVTFQFTQSSSRRLMAYQHSFSSWLICIVVVSSCTLLNYVDTSSTDLLPGIENANKTAAPTGSTQAYQQLGMHADTLVDSDYDIAEERMLSAQWIRYIWEKLMSLGIVKRLFPHLYIRFAADKEGAALQLIKIYERKFLGSFLESMWFIKWTRAVLKAYNHEPSLGYDLLFRCLMRRYHSQSIQLGKDFAKIELSAATSEMIYEIGVRLLQYYKSMKISTDHLFKELGLQENHIRLDNPNVVLWNFYVGYLHSEQFSYEALLSKMKDQVDIENQFKIACARGGFYSMIGWGLRLHWWKQKKYNKTTVWYHLRLNDIEKIGYINWIANAKVWVAYAWIKDGPPSSISSFYERIRSRISSKQLAEMIASNRNRDTVGRILNDVYALAAKHEKGYWADFVRHVDSLSS
ncbi:hypothetical protein Plhal304r1_c031g0099831 [Plasmopara halstedii]